MEMATGIIRLAEISAMNGGKLPTEIAHAIESYMSKEPTPTGWMEKAIDDTVNLALYGPGSNKQ